MIKTRHKKDTFADSGFEIATKKTRKRIFLEEMNAVAPWASLIGIIQGYAPWAESGRPPFPAETMLRIYLLQHFLEEFGLTKIILAKFNAILQSKGLLLRSGTAIFARLMAAPSSPKIDGGMRNPAMHQTKKGSQYHFGMKAHIGVDAESGLVHTLVTTAANVHDVTQAQDLLHGEETDVFADSGYRGGEKREEANGLQVNWQIAMMPGKGRALNLRTASGQLRNVAERVIKCPLGLTKGRYRGLAKNTA